MGLGIPGLNFQTEEKTGLGHSALCCTGLTRLSGVKNRTAQNKLQKNLRTFYSKVMVTDMVVGGEGRAKDSLPV